MPSNQIYAVVDIETTGTDPKLDRIIQFGCVLIQKGEIISRFSTDVNPNQAISKQIQQLTGITNNRVKKAPYFEDVATTIYNLLKDTIFVAHNIYFDYSFLSKELVRCGVPKLTNPGIDTVELAQIFFPTEKSFRLTDLSESFGFIHEAPHQADSDAQVTAELLLRIEEKIKCLPLITMETIAQLSSTTGMQTSQYIHHIYDEMKKEIKPLPKEVQVVEGIALRRKVVPLFEEKLYGDKDYPKSKKNKEKQFKQKLHYRSEQSRMMNLIYEQFTTNQSKDLFIEATTGIGKTFGYLFPISYLATPENPVIISTVSIVLQNQLADKEIPFANQFCPEKIQATVIKSHRHYLDLQRFRATLQQPIKQKQYAIYQMGVLVWLTESETGDLDELQLTSFAHSFWKDVAHRGVDFLTKKDGLYEEDFVRFLYKKSKQSNVLIVNHAFLVQETHRALPVLPKSKYLIIDEAHHLSEIAGKVATRQFNFLSFKKQVRLSLDDGQLFDQIDQIMCEEEQVKRLLRIYCKALGNLVEEFSDLFYELNQLVQQSSPLHSAENTLLITKALVDLLPIQGQQVSQNIDIILSEMLEIQEKVKQYILKELDKYTLSNRIDFGHLLHFFDQVHDIEACFDTYMNQWSWRWVKEYTKTGPEEGILAINDLEADRLPSTSWYFRYEKIVYTGGTLTFGNKKEYLPKRLGLEVFRFKSLPDPYNYEENARVFIPQEALDVNQSETKELSTFVVSVLKTLLPLNRSILFLFTSHDVLKRVYHHVQPILLREGRELLAQGITGSREKIVKRFAHNPTSILLGADSFWEGIDLPGDQLSLLVVTKLPFENPKQPFVAARYSHLESQGINSFTQEALPKAALKLRQAFGRLIRSETDKGALVILDRRILTAKYGKKMLRTLPKELSIQEKKLCEIKDELKGFFTEE